MQLRLRNLLIVIILLAAFVIPAYLFFNSKTDGDIVSVFESVTEVFNTPTPSNFAFREITIPYLRNKKYESSLGQLTKVGENQNYTTYLTSYVSDGLKINGLLTRPKVQDVGDGLPAIVFVHGYIPPEEYRTTQNYSAYVDYFAKSGFVVFKIDLRGHGDSEGEAGGAYYSGDYIIDTLNAYSALQKLDFVNPKKIGLWGHSMAGNIVMRTLASSPDIPAIVIWAGAGYTYSDLQAYMIQDTSYQPPPTNTVRARKRQELREAYGTFDPNHWFWKQVPATNYLSDIKGAIQLNHAVNDNVVSIEYSRNLDALLYKTTIPHELHEYPTGGHNIEGNNFTLAMRNSVEFFKNYLR